MIDIIVFEEYQYNILYLQYQDLIKQMPFSLLTYSLSLLMMRMIICQNAYFISPRNAATSQVTTYQFFIQIDHNLELLQLSPFTITFPPQYQNRLLNSTYACSLQTWIVEPIPDITCQVQYPYMYINNLAPTPTTISKDQFFQLSINGILNPLSIQTTQSFVYKYLLADGSFEVNTGDGINFLPAQMQCLIDTTPNKVNVIAALNLNCMVPQFPAGSTLQITFNSQWVQTQVQPTNVVAIDNISCKTATNAYLSCYYQLSNPNSVITINNLPSPTNQNNLSFYIEFIQNPPTTKAQGNIKLISLFNNNKMSETKYQKLLSLLPGSINQALFLPETLIVNQETKGLLTFRTPSILQETDIISVKFPKEISLSKLTEIHLVDFGVYLRQLTIINQVINITGIKAYRGNAVTLMFNNVINPSSELQTQKFTITTERNGYQIDELDVNLTFSARRSQIINAQLNCSSLQIGQLNICELHLKLNQSLGQTSAIVVQLPLIYYGRVGSCSPLPCLLQSNKIIFQVRNKVKDELINMKLIDVLHPLTLGKTTSFILYTLFQYDDPSSIVQYTNKNLSLTLIPRRIIKENILINSNSIVSNQYPTLYSFYIKNMNSLPAFSYVEIHLPVEMQYMASDKIICSVQDLVLDCLLIDRNGSKIVKMSYLSSSAIDSGLLQQKLITLNNLVNPKLKGLTSTFKIYIYNSGDQIIQYIDDGLLFNISQHSKFSYLNIQSNHSVNSEIASLEVSFAFPNNILYTNNTLIVIAFSTPLNAPPQINCTPLSNNIIALSSCTLTNNTISFIIAYNSLTSDTLTNFKIHPYLNFHSFQPYNIQLNLFSDVGMQSKLASNELEEVELKNNVSGRLYLDGYEFKDQIIYSSSNLTINIRNATSHLFLYLLITFPSEFSIINSHCPLNSLYTCQLTNNYTLKINFLNTTYIFPISISINNIITPTSSHSNRIYLQSYSANNYLVDSNNQIIFTSLCSLPCQTCINSSAINTCTSCFQNLTFEDRVLLFDNRCISNCTLGQYFSQISQQCLQCGDNCSSCGSGEICFLCGNNTSLYNFSCVAECPLGYFSHLGTCLACSMILKCQTCVNNTCLSCLSGYLLYNNICVDACPLSLFYTNNINKTCDPCPSYCQSCFYNTTSSTVECGSCLRGYVLQGRRCFLQCRIVGNLAVDGICLGCSSLCLTCSKSINNCTSCQMPPISFFMNFNCISQCPNGYYPNITTYLCMSCSSPCQNCINSSTNSCLTCISGYFQLQNQCLIKCTLTYYSMNMKCLSCKSPCLACQSQLICLSCLNNTYLFDNSCLTKCPAGMIVTNFTCLACPVTCKSCTADGCISCISNTYLYSNICVFTCPDKTYGNNLTLSCQDCTSPCVNCFNRTFCTSCINTTVRVIDNGTCLACSSPCLTCQSYSNNCTSCISALPSLFYFNYTCVNACPSKYYKETSPSKLQCLSCHFKCSQCFQRNDNCTSCISGLYLSDTNNCVNACPDGTFIDLQINTCKVCSIDCKTCRNLTVCTSCFNSLRLYGNECLASCLNNVATLLNYICDICRNNCKTCINSNLTYCTSCFNHQYLFDSQCLDTCPNSHYLDTSGSCLFCLFPCQSCSNYNICTSCLLSNHTLIDGVCQLCGLDCLTCEGLITNCTSCSINSNKSILFGGKCLQKCPRGYYSLNNTCLECHYSCSQCLNNTTTCTSCSYGLFLFNGFCLTKCPSTYYQNYIDNLCYRCSNSCIECLGMNICTTCPQTYYLNGSICVYNCSISVISINSICQICSNTCKTCQLSNGSINICTSCITGKYYYNYSCIDGCPIGFYKANGQCPSCVNNCLQCISESICTRCLTDEGRVLVNGSCVKCSSFCRTCLEDVDKCSSCSATSGYPYLLSNTCLSKCPQVYFSHENTCIKCQEDCLSCLSLSQCTKCRADMLLQNKLCVYQCSNTYYLNNGTCYLCNYPCSKCYDYKTCTSCLFGYKLQGSNCVIQCLNNQTSLSPNICAFCDANCLTCSSNNISSCTSCLSPLFQHQSVCLNACVDSFYGNNVTNRCQSCKNLCQSCWNLTYCLTCKNSTFLFRQTHACVYDCSLSAYYNNISLGQCSPCSQYCIKCTNSSTCIICMNQTYFLLAYQCQKCSPSCSTCSIMNHNCTSCMNTTYLFNSSCTSSCPQNYYSKLNKCQVCSHGCKACTNSTACLICFSSHLKLQQEGTYKCISSCPVNYIYNINTYSCDLSPSDISKISSIGSGSDVPQFLWLILCAIALFLLLLLKYKYEKTFFSLACYIILSLSSSACLISLLIVQFKSEFISISAYLIIIIGILQIILTLSSLGFIVKTINSQSNNDILYWDQNIILKVIVIVFSFLDSNSFFILFTYLMHFEAFNIKISMNYKNMEKLYYFNIVSTIILKILNISYSIMVIYASSIIQARLLYQTNPISSISYIYGIEFMIISAFCIVNSIYLLHFFYNQETTNNIQKGESHQSLNQTLKEVFDKRNQSNSQLVLELDNNDFFQDLDKKQSQQNEKVIESKKKTLKRKKLKKLELEQKIDEQQEESDINLQQLQQLSASNNLKEGDYTQLHQNSPEIIQKKIFQQNLVKNYEDFQFIQDDQEPSSFLKLNKIQQNRHVPQQNTNYQQQQFQQKNMQQMQQEYNNKNIVQFQLFQFDNQQHPKDFQQNSNMISDQIVQLNIQSTIQQQPKFNKNQQINQSQVEEKVNQSQDYKNREQQQNDESIKEQKSQKKVKRQNKRGSSTNNIFQEFEELQQIILPSAGQQKKNTKEKEILEKEKHSQNIYDNQFLQNSQNIKEDEKNRQFRKKSQDESNQKFNQFMNEFEEPPQQNIRHSSVKKQSRSSVELSKVKHQKVSMPPLRKRYPDVPHPAKKISVIQYDIEDNKFVQEKQGDSKVQFHESFSLQKKSRTSSNLKNKQSLMNNDNKSRKNSFRNIGEMIIDGSQKSHRSQSSDRQSTKK